MCLKIVYREAKVTLRLLFCISWFIPMSWIVLLCLVLLFTLHRATGQFCGFLRAGRSSLWMWDTLAGTRAVITETYRHYQIITTFEAKMVGVAFQDGCDAPAVQRRSRWMARNYLRVWDLNVHDNDIVIRLAFWTLSIVLFLFRVTFQRLNFDGDRE
jgi:hypothetical protein